MRVLALARLQRPALAVVLAGLVLLSASVHAQPMSTLRIGGTTASWQRGGDGVDPLLVAGTLYSPLLDTTNTPGDAIDFAHRPGWISPLYFEEKTNVSWRVLEGDGSIRAPNAVEEKKVVNAQLPEIVNGNHAVAFTRKPTKVVPLNPFGIWIILDFANPIGVHRVRFYPRNTVVESAQTPFHNDFLRGYELWINETQTSRQRAPDMLVARETSNEEAVVDLAVPVQYTRLVKLKSLSDAAWEIDEIEVYAQGYLQTATYLTDLLDLGDRATLGAARWREEVIGKDIRSSTSVRVRTGVDDTPLIYHRKILDSLGVWLGEVEEVEGQVYAGLDRRQRGVIEPDDEHWSPWKSLRSGELITAPGQRRYLQYQIDVEGQLFDTRQVNWLSFDYLQPPLADTLRAEVYPRRVRAEERATFRYGILLRAAGAIRGFDRLEVDANARIEDIRGLTVNGETVSYEIDYVRADGFALNLPLVKADSTVVEFTFDVPVFRFGTTFSGRAYHRASGRVPQRLEPGNAMDFGPGDHDQLSGLSVAIPREQVGQLVGEIAVLPPVFTPNGDLVNDQVEVFFNLLQLTKPTPVRLEIHDLSGRFLHCVFDEELTIGPSLHRWDGRLTSGALVPAGHYVWVLTVRADAFEERHVGVLGVVY